MASQTGQAGKTPEAGQGAKAGPGTRQSPVAEQQTSIGTSAIETLKQDHRKAEQLFAQYKSASDAATKMRLIRQVCRELIVHTKLEEEIFYPACREAGCEDDVMDEAQVEHDSAKMLIADLLHADPEEQFTDAKVSVLAEQIRHHVAEEEKPGQGIFAQAEAHGVGTGDLARRLIARKQELQGRAADARPTRVVSFNVEESMMPRYRDERGRFSGDDEYEDRSGRGRSRGSGHGGWFGDSEGHREASREGWQDRGYSHRSSFDDEDDDRRGGYRGNDRDRDERGRFMSDDDRGDRSRGSRYDEEEDRSRGYRGGDRERDEHGRFMSDDDRGYRSRRSRYDEDERGYRSNDRERDERGRFMSDDDEDDRYRRGRGHGGWFGDSEGHAEAARHRGRSYGRSRREDDDDRSSAHEHGGWFGDARGHAQAARRGWQHRR
jgi:hemerythrin superfamily protein